MTRIELGTGVGAQNFTPIDFAYTRTTKDGNVPVINYLIGSHYNERIDGLFTFSDTGEIENDTVVTTGGKLEIAGDDAVAENTSTKRATHSTFMYFWPKTIIRSNSELSVRTVGEITPAVGYDLIARTVFEDLSTGDQIIVELHAGNSVAVTNAYLTLSEKVAGSILELARFILNDVDLKIDWELKFLDEGVSKFGYQEVTGEPTNLWKGTFKADVAEAKVFHELETNEASPTRTVKFDFIWILYKSIFVGYDVPIEDKLLGCVCIWDTITKGETDETKWVRVFSKDHEFLGERVIENAIIRCIIRDTPELEIYGWQTFDTPAWVRMGSILPRNSADNAATVLVDAIITKYNDSSINFKINFGIVEYTISLKKAMSYFRIRTRSKHFNFTTTKERFAFSADVPATNLTKWNMEHSDDSNRGNPLGTYESVTNPRIFTDDTDTDTGLQHIDDNWFAFYNTGENDVVAWIGTIIKPNALEIEATSSTVLKEARFGFIQPCIICVGVLTSKPNTKTNGIPKMFFPGVDDEYVKWKANAGVFAFDQNPFVRKRR